MKGSARGLVYLARVIYASTLSAVVVSTNSLKLQDSGEKNPGLKLGSQVLLLIHAKDQNSFFLLRIIVMEQLKILGKGLVLQGCFEVLRSLI